MDFDEMLATWRTQDTAPLYRVNHDALLQALHAEEARVRGELRWLLWFTCIFGTGMAVFGGVWVSVLIYQGDEPAIYTVAAAAGVGLYVLWIGATGVSRWRQAKRERNFGNTLQEEVRRSLALVDYQLSR